MAQSFSQVLNEHVRGWPHKGCTEAEVRGLEQRHSVKLPGAYIELLRRCGHGSDGLWLGHDYEFKWLDDMQEAARELARASGPSLPEGAFAFFMSQGCWFFFLLDGAVYFFLEGDKDFTRKYDSFEEFFADTHEI